MKTGSYKEHLDASSLKPGGVIDIEEPGETKVFCPVEKPPHYMILDTEAIRLIRWQLTRDQWYGYCLGNILKYRMRAGKKGDAKQDLAKAEKYERLYEEYK